MDAVNRFPLRWLLSLLVALAIGFALHSWLRPQQEASPPALISLERMGQLVSVKVNVADVVEFTENRTFDIPWSSWQLAYAGTRVLLIVKGDCLVATDLSAARYASVDAEHKTLTIELPAPRVLQARLNHDDPSVGGSRLYSFSDEGLEALVPGNENRTRAIDAAMRLGQARVEAAGRSPSVIQAAKNNAELVVKGTYSALGWTATIRWR